MPIVKQNVPNFKQPSLSFTIPSPRPAPPSHIERGYNHASIQRKHLCDSFPITDNNLVKSLNCKAVFSVDGHLKLNFLTDTFPTEPKSTPLKGLRDPDNPMYFKLL